MKKVSFAISLALMGSSTSLYAQEDYLVNNSQGITVFQVRFFDQGDGPFMGNAAYPTASTWNLNQQQKENVLDAVRYWAEIITPQSGQLPAIINVGTFNEINAAGSSDKVTSDGEISYTQLEAALTNVIDARELTFGSHAQFVLGPMGYNSVPNVPSQTPRTGLVDLTSVSLHELGHSLGLINSVSDRNGPNSLTPIFDNDFPFSPWTLGLRDDNGNPAKPGQVILCQGCNNPYDPQGFDVRLDKGYFTGEHVTEVLAGSMPGVPVRMLAYNGANSAVDTDYMSHTELTNSTMSHQAYRNYTAFMEAELAILQDMGYQIDRRNFYGFSIYGDGQTLVNQHGYSLRNAQGTAYIPGQYNTALLGLGLHVYGSNNQIFQEADLLTIGAGAAGVRIDGQNNTLNIEPGTRIYADGVNGRGVMFTYGKDHNLIQRGDIQALGADGVALSFDFGNNQLGNDSDYRGSYIHTVNGTSVDLLPELTGALADNVNISGRVAGQSAAILISQNALVNHINILEGAQLTGNIISDYDQRDVYGQQRLTQLSFGRLADLQGRATDQADANFMLNYQGNITGINNLALNASGGMTSLNGSHQIYSMYIAPGAILSGNSDYTLNQAGRFVNDGTLTPGNSLGQITVNGDYQQGTQGQLQLEVDGHGGHDTLAINGNAKLDGQLTFMPQRDWYATDWQMNSADLLKTNSYSGEFSAVNSQLTSPTLTLQTLAQGNNTWQLAIQRDANAYSQYAQDSNARQVGQALDRIVAIARSDMQSLYSALDFSAADGSGIGKALNQLSPAGYSAMFASSLHREQQVADIISSRHFTTAPKQLMEDEWQSFAIPFGGGFWQKNQGDSVGYNASSYGIVFGAEKQSVDYRDWVFGFHGAISGQSVTLKSPQNGTGKTTAFDLGLQARYAVDPQAGTYLFGNGRFGYEDGQMDRNVGAEGYGAKDHADWGGMTGSVMAGGGYLWEVSEGLSVGPLAALNYTMLSRNGTTESGSDGSRLKLDAKTFNSLRSSIGVSGNWDLPLPSGSVMTTDLQLTWDHELLDTDLVQTASFANYGNTSFSSKNQVTGRDAMGIKAGVAYKINKDVELGMGVASDVFRSGYDSVSGNLSATWRF